MWSRPDRTGILEEWIQRAATAPVREVVQADGRIRRWAQIPERVGRYRRVVLLADGETVHNAFFDRGFTDDARVPPAHVGVVSAADLDRRPGAPRGGVGARRHHVSDQRGAGARGAGSRARVGVGARVVGARRCGLWHQSRLPRGADGARPAVLRAGRREYHGVAGCPRPAGTASVSWPRRPRRHLPRAAVPEPSALDDIATTVPPTAWHTVTWRQGTKGPMRSRLAHTTVWPAHRWTSGGPAPSAPVRLLIE